MLFQRVGLVMSFALAIFIAGMLGVSGRAQAQAASSPDISIPADGSASAPATGASGPGDAASDAARSPADDEVPPLQPAFGALKLGNDVAVLVSAAVGLGLFVWLRRGLRYSSAAKGYAAALVTMVLLFVLLNWVMPSRDASSCAGAVLAFGKDATLYADTCRLAREGAANFGGLVSLYRQTFITANSEYVIPLGPVAVRVLSFFTLLIGTTVLYWLLLPVAKKTFVAS